jgi:predicted RNA-binding Zn-ribbon protein involved in translation (DUF1610 family)
MSSQCPACGKTSELETKTSSGTKCECPDCGMTWDPKKENEPPKLRNGQRFPVPVFASMPTRQVLNAITDSWGELTDIDPGLLQFDRTYVGGQRNVHTTGGDRHRDFTGGERHQLPIGGARQTGTVSAMRPRGPHKPILPKGLGQHSPKKNMPIRTAMEGLRAIVDGEAIGAVFMIDDKQKFAIWRQKTGQFILKITAEARQTNLFGALNNNFRNGQVVPQEKLYHIINGAKKNAKGHEVTAIVVYEDAVRSELQNQRYSNRRGHPLASLKNTGPGSEFLHPSGKEFKDQARQALNSRLEKFKASGAAGVDTPESLVAFIKEKGYLNRIRVGNYSYKLEDSRLSVRDIATATAGKVDKWGSGFTVAYRWDDTGNSKNYWDLGDERPPYEFKVHLRLQGGNIVPTEVHLFNRDDGGPNPSQVFKDTPEVGPQAENLVNSVLAAVREEEDEEYYCDSCCQKYKITMPILKSKCPHCGCRDVFKVELKKSKNK